MQGESRVDAYVDEQVFARKVIRVFDTVFSSLPEVAER